MASIGNVDGVELLSKEIGLRLQEEQVNDSELFLLVQRIMQLSVRLFSSSRMQNKLRARKELDLMLEQLSKHCKQMTSWKAIAPQMVAGVGTAAAGVFGICAHSKALPYSLASINNPGVPELEAMRKDWEAFANYGSFGGQVAQGVPGAMSMMTAALEAEKKSSDMLIQLHSGAKSANEQSSHQDLTSQKALQSGAEQAAQSYAQAARSVAQ